MRSFLGKLLKHRALAKSAPSPFDRLFLQANNAAASDQFALAVQLFDRAIALDASGADVHYKRANALKNLGKLDDALASYDRAIERRPDFAYAYCNRGVVQQSLGLFAEALASYDRAINIEPNDALTHYNRALLLQEHSRWDEVLVSYERAVSIDPTFADAQYNRSLALLYRGDFGNGWRGYEWRWKNAQRLAFGTPRNFSQPLWLGAESLAGRRVLLHCEGGLGDTIQFCRYAPLIASQGATVLLEVQAPLIELLGCLDGVSLLFAAGNPAPPFDYHCPLMSLPLACKTTLDSIPTAPHYIRSEEAKVRHWRDRLESSGRPRIGLAWSGNPHNTVDERRSIALARWLNHLPREFQYVCLQKEIRPADAKILSANPWILRVDHELRDFTDTAALCECMDLVISVDTSLAHLSGALERPTWILLPLNPDWRWLTDRTDSPWYPSARLYRQSGARDWDEVLHRVAVDLRREFAVDCAPMLTKIVTK